MIVFDECPLPSRVVSVLLDSFAHGSVMLVRPRPAHDGFLLGRGVGIEAPAVGGGGQAKGPLFRVRVVSRRLGTSLGRLSVVLQALLVRVGLLAARTPGTVRDRVKA